MYAKPMRALIHAFATIAALPMAGMAADDGSHSGDSAANTTAQQMGEHPAVAIAKTWRIRGYEEASNIASHPALLPRAMPAPPAEPSLAPDGTVDYVPVAAKRSADSGSAR